jgi:hypothetical protein
MNPDFSSHLADIHPEYCHPALCGTEYSQDSMSRMGFAMDADEEVVAYLQALIDHYHDCTLDDCPRCALIRGACENVRNRIFDSGVRPAAVATQKAIRKSQPHRHFQMQ